MFSAAVEANMKLEKVSSQPHMKVSGSGPSSQKDTLRAGPNPSAAAPGMMNPRGVKTTDTPQAPKVAVKKTSASASDTCDLKALLKEGHFDISRFYVDRNKYKKLDLINSGSFGKVLVCECVDTGERLAMKKLRGNPSDDKARQQYEREIAILGTVRHPAILSLRGCTPYSEQNSWKDPLIIMPLMKNGSVEDMIKKEMDGHCPAEWTPTRKHIVLYGTASKLVEAGHTLEQSGILGTPTYMAPEIWDGTGKFAYEVDVYAFGMIMYAVLTGSIPFGSVTTVDQLRRQTRGGIKLPFPSSMNQGYRDIIQCCWEFEPKARPSFADIVEVLADPVFNEIINAREFSKYQDMFEMERETPSSSMTSTQVASQDQQNDAFRNGKWLDISTFYVDVKEFEKLEIIGSGAFGKVWKCKSRKTGVIVAKKKLQYSNKPMAETDYKREVGLMGNMRHPALLELIGCTPWSSCEPTIMTRFAPNGCVNDMIKKEMDGHCPAEWTPTRKHIVLYGTACGMAYMHEHRLIHRDLKPANILLDENFEPKIADFGFSKFVETGQTLEQSRDVGTPMYMAPEIWDGTGNFGFEVDVFSFGMIMYAVLAGSMPYSRKVTIYEIMRIVPNGKRPQLTSNIPSGYWPIIKRCWETSPALRPTFDEVVEDLKAVTLGNVPDFHKFRAYQQKLEKSTSTVKSGTSIQSNSTSVTQKGTRQTHAASFGGANPPFPKPGPGMAKAEAPAPVAAKALPAPVAAKALPAPVAAEALPARVDIKVVPSSSATKPAVTKSGPEQLQCSCVQHGKSNILQKFYHCWTCDLVGSHGMCEACMKACHSGHKIVGGDMCSSCCSCGSKGCQCQIRDENKSKSPSYTKPTQNARPSPDPKQILPAKLRCSYEQHGSVYIEQKWYHCHTCGLVGHLGMCEACMKTCHVGHKIDGGGLERAYCDCGAGAQGCRCKICDRKDNSSVSVERQTENPAPTQPSQKIVLPFGCPRPVSSTNRCTYEEYGMAEIAQKWYHCKTCGLVGELGMCEACMKACHAGHNVTGGAISPKCYCNCGARTTGRPCTICGRGDDSSDDLSDYSSSYSSD